MTSVDIDWHDAYRGGRGSAWPLIHRTSLDVRTQDDLAAFIDGIEAVSHKISIDCQCSLHYHAALSLLRYPELDAPLSCFYWSVDLHNVINGWLGKSTISGSEALRLYIADASAALRR